MYSTGWHLEIRCGKPRSRVLCFLLLLSLALRSNQCLPLPLSLPKRRTAKPPPIDNNDNRADQTQRATR